MYVRGSNTEARRTLVHGVGCGGVEVDDIGGGGDKDGDGGKELEGRAIGVGEAVAGEVVAGGDELY